MMAGELCRLCSCLDWSLPSPSEMQQPSRGVTRIGLQDDITFIGSAAAMNRSRNSIGSSLADAGHRLRGYKCGVWAPGFEQFEDQELPTEVHDLCTRVPRERHGVSLLVSAANTQYGTHVGLGQLAEPPTQTLATLQSIERFACDQHDHVSSAKVWMLIGKGVARALDYDFRLVPPAVMAPLQRRLEGELRRTLTVLFGSEVSELAWERAKLPTCFGGLGIRVAQMGFAAQATYWSAVDLHKAVMTTICGTVGRPLQGAHLEEVTALAAKADLLAAGVAVDDYAKVMVEHEASLVYEASPWAVDKRAAEIVRPAPVQSADWVPPKSLARDMAFAKLQSRILSAAEAVQAAKLRGDMSPEQQAIMLSAGETRHWHVLDGHAQIADGVGTECAMEDGNGAATRRDTRCRPALHVCSVERK